MFPGMMSETTTFAPFLASSMAIDCPIPLAAPVTIATLFFRLNILPLVMLYGFDYLRFLIGRVFKDCIVIVFMKEVVKPWGGERHFVKNDKCTVKILSVKAGHRFSLQKHRLRVEEWYFLTDGYAQVGKKVSRFKEGDFVRIGKGKIHRLIAKKKRVDVLEVSRGEFLQSDEIRLEDDYGRT